MQPLYPVEDQIKDRLEPEPPQEGVMPGGDAEWSAAENS